MKEVRPLGRTTSVACIGLQAMKPQGLKPSDKPARMSGLKPGPPKIGERQNAGHDSHVRVAKNLYP